MAVTLDMTMPHDMQTLNCVQIVMCASNCTTLACAQACLAEGKPASQQAAGALLQCVQGACASDGGVDTGCATTVGGQALSGTGPCAAQGTACTQN